MAQKKAVAFTFSIISTMTLSFKIALAADCIALLVAFYFIISDSLSYTSNNGPLSLVTLLFAAWVAVSFFLYQGGYKTVGSIMAWVPAVPIIGYGLMILLFVIFKPDMR
jgi:hypothetical protein